MLLRICARVASAVAGPVNVNAVFAATVNEPVPVIVGVVLVAGMITVPTDVPLFEAVKVALFVVAAPTFSSNDDARLAKE